MQLINLTPHSVNLCSIAGNIVLSIPPSGKVARVVKDYAYEMSSINVDGSMVDVEYLSAFNDIGFVAGVKEPVEGIGYIVSSMVMEHHDMRGRKDVFSPATGPKDGAIRKDGQIVGVTKLRCNSKP